MDEQQVQQMVIQWRNQLEKSMVDMKLRQWCVEQAIKAIDGAGGRPAYVVNGEINEPGRVEFAVVRMAEDILKFITAPFAEVFSQARPGESQSE